MELTINRVFSTLSQMPNEDLKRLQKFMASPIFNQSKSLSKLCNLLTQLVQKGKKGFYKEKTWAKIYPDKPYNDVNFRKSCSDLLALIEQFFSLEMYLKDKNRQFINQIEYLSSNKIESLYNGVISKNENVFKEKTYKTQDDYYFFYSFEKTYYKLMDFDVKANPKLNIEKISENLDIFYLIDKLKMICNTLVQKLRSRVDYDLNDINAILMLCQKYDLGKHPELAIYYHSYRTLTDGDNHEHYFRLKSLLEINAQYLSQNEAIEILDTALNYCIGRVNKGDKKFLQEYFDLFMNAINRGVFIENGELATWRFNNIVVMGLRLGRLDWADEFVEKNKKLLPNDVRQNIVKFNLARISSYKKDYQTVLDLVRDIEYDDIIINLISKTMIVFAYYEMDEYEPLDSFIESFRTFINRQKDIQPGLKRGYLNLLGFTRRLMKLNSRDKNVITKLREDIIAAKANTVNQEWLLEKLEELK